MDTSRSKTALSTRTMWAILAVVIIADVMDLLDASITNIAAPSIVRELGGGVHPGGIHGGGIGKGDDGHAVHHVHLDLGVVHLSLPGAFPAE